MSSLIGAAIGAAIGAFAFIAVSAMRKRQRFLDSVAKGMIDREQRNPANRAKRAIYFPKEFRGLKDRDETHR